MIFTVLVATSQNTYSRQLGAKAVLKPPRRLSSPAHLRRLDRLEDKPLPPRGEDLLQPVAVQHVGLVHPHRDSRRRLVRDCTNRLYGLLPRLPQAERQALAPLVSLALEVAKQASGIEGLRVGSVVVLAQELEIGVRPTHGAEDDQVEPVEGTAGERGRPAKAIPDGPRRVVRIYRGDPPAGSAHELELHRWHPFFNGAEEERVFRPPPLLAIAP